MDERTLEWFDILGRGLLWGAVAVLALAVIGAITVASSDTAVFFEQVEREGRGVAALASLGIGIALAGGLAGIGALLRLKVAEYRRGPVR